jgi:hypothetical protein
MGWRGSTVRFTEVVAELRMLARPAAGDSNATYAAVPVVDGSSTIPNQATLKVLGHFVCFSGESLANDAVAAMGDTVCTGGRDRV